MNKYIKYSVGLIVGAFILTGCSSVAVKNIDHSPVVANSTLTNSKVQKVIKASGQALGWRFKDISAGKMLGFINVRNKHTAVIDISYDKDSYSINYKKSANLKYDPEKGTIHKAYNSWITNLKNSIDFELSLM